MTHARDEVLKRLWHGSDPFAGFPTHLYQVDLQGWGDDHPWLTEAIAELRPRYVLEVGVWKGASVVRMASALQRLRIDGVVIAVDTWLGSAEHWLTMIEQLGMEHGRPGIQKKFMINVMSQGVMDFVVPLPLDSLNAARVVAAHGIALDLIHLDGGHDYASVLADLQAWWPLVTPGGMMIGDDYYAMQATSGVTRAFDEYFGRQGLALEVAGQKCRVRKPPL